MVGAESALPPWPSRRPDEPRRWREVAAATFSTRFLTESELAELMERPAGVPVEYDERLDRDRRPPGNRPAVLQTYAFPLPEVCRAAPAITSSDDTGPELASRKPIRRTRRR
jgi:hypothetical protein